MLRTSKRSDTEGGYSGSLFLVSVSLYLVLYSFDASPIPASPEKDSPVITKSTPELKEGVVSTGLGMSGPFAEDVKGNFSDSSFFGSASPPQDHFLLR